MRGRQKESPQATHYAIDEGSEKHPTPIIDDEPLELFTRFGGQLPQDLQATYDALSAELERILTSERPCPRNPPLGGSYKFTIDGNLDGLVNGLDLADLAGLHRPGVRRKQLVRRQSGWQDGWNRRRPDRAVPRDRMRT